MDTDGPDSSCLGVKLVFCLNYCKYVHILIRSNAVLVR
jgi:hypothetical protein